MVSIFKFAVELCIRCHVHVLFSIILVMTYSCIEYETLGVEGVNAHEIMQFVDLLSRLTPLTNTSAQSGSELHSALFIRQFLKFQRV